MASICMGCQIITKTWEKLKGIEHVYSDVIEMTYLYC